MLDLTAICQAKYGSLKSAASEQLPMDLRFVSKDELPLKRQHRLMLSREEHWRVLMNDYTYLRQSLTRIHKIYQMSLQNEHPEGFSEANILNDKASGDPKGYLFLPFDLLDHDVISGNMTIGMKSHKSRKNREWEKRQKGYKAIWLRIDNVARVRKARVRQELRNSGGWRYLSPEEQSQREMDAFAVIEKERQEKKAMAKASYMETHEQVL